ncbi:MAG: glycosyltransferase family 2 protein [Ruminococcaceae bacterium]|nr:glycosyltransferase family 2 protein [Oscillospiraceae bacterium]
MDLSLIIPCYNEEKNIRKLYEETRKAFSGSGIGVEYVFVNDGSTDKTEQVLTDLFKSEVFSNITVVSFSRNFGKEAAILAGLNNSTGEYTCIIDADLQQRPETARKMLDIIRQNDDIDCVCAFQTQRRESKFISAMKGLYYKVMNNMAETEFKNGASDFRLFNSKVKNAVLSLGEYHRFSKGIFSWVGFNVYYMEYKADERNEGITKWSIGKLIKYAVGGLLSFSTVPLKISMYIGSAATVFSLIYLIITVIRKLTSHINVDGFTQLVILITFFSGVLLFTLGIIGEYIAKIYQQIKNRPIYITKNILKRNNEK